NKCQLALTVCPENVNAHLYTGYFFKLAEKYEDAEKEFKKAIDLNPMTSSRARLNLGLLNIEKISSKNFKMNYALKSAYYLTTGAIFSIFDYPYVRMGMQKIRESFSVGKYLITGSLFQKFGLDKNAIKTFKHAQKETGRSEIFGKLIGDLDIKNENVESALESYENVLKVNPLDRESLLKKATILQTYFEGREDEAIDAYTKALETEGDKDYIYYELGHLYLKKKDVINSINAFKLAVEKDQTNAFFHNALGFALFTAGQYDEAEDHYLVAINMNPDAEWTATVCRACALIYSDVKKNPEKAIRMYMQSLSLFPNCADTYLSLGDLYFDEQDYDKALENYTKSIELNPNDHYVFNKLATCLWQKDFVEEAIISYRHAIDLNPEYDAAYNNLGAVYLDGKQMYHEAKDCFLTAIEKNPEYEMAYYNAGRAFEELGDKIQAAKFYQKALELNEKTHQITTVDVQAKIFELFEN
ncbi:MAG: tetratricopeptide repeat protein, partial [bacterium]|nr:tetratricopeptide repeat protein [bacterium]